MVAMLFSVEMPTGIDAALFLTFTLMGFLGVVLCRARRDPLLAAVSAVHALAGVLSVLAADLITLLVSWEILTFSAYVIIRRGGPRSRDGAYWYLAGQITAAALFFVAMVVHAGESGSVAVGVLEAGAQPFMAAAVLIKTAMMPLHGWLIGAYTRAPYVGSFVLSAYATKVGVYTASRTLSFALGGLPLLSLVGAVVAVVAVGAALRQHSARRLLSYHIISQVGYMLAGVGLVGSGLGITAGLFHAVNHIIYKGLLFLVVAFVADYFGHDDLRRMGGLARRFPLVFVCAVVGAAAIVGVPFTSGYASKELLKKSLGGLQTALLVTASLGTGLSFTKFIYLIFLRPADKRGAHGGAAPATAVGALVVLAALSVLNGVVPRIVPGVPDLSFYGASSILWGAAPAAAAIILWFPLRKRLTAGATTIPEDPPLRGYILRGSRTLLSRLRRAYRVDPQRTVATAIVGACSLVLIIVFLT